MQYQIFSDISCDLSETELAQYHIYPKLIPFDITINDQVVHYNSAEDFYRAIDSKKIKPGSIHTAASTPAVFRALLEDMHACTDPATTLVYAGISPQMSSTANSARLGIESFCAAHPTRRVLIVDTMSISNGLGLYLQYLSAYTGNRLETYAEELGKQIVHLFTLRDFSFARGSGRFTLKEQIIMLAASALNISPWMYFPSDDKLQTDSKKRYRGDIILRRWCEYYYSHRAATDEPIRIGYGGARELARAEKFIHLLTTQGDVTRAQIQLARVSPIIGAHTGDTVLSVFFRQRDPR